MGTIRSTLNNILALDLAKEGMSVVADMKPDFIQANKEQLLEGRVKDGGKFQQRYASIQYAERKHRMNPTPGKGIPDLYNTGAFFEGFKLDILDKNTYSINSTNSKNAMLVKKYGAVIPFFGLNPESRTQIINNGFYYQLMDRIRAVTKL